MGDECNSQTVLVVDDVETNVLILEEILKDNYHVITANNGEQALEALRVMPTPPKLILLDVFMPVMTGYEMFKIMKQDESLRRIPVIFITTADSESEALSAGAVDFISKPFVPEIVKLRVKNHVALKNYSDNLEEMVAEKTAEATKTLDSALQGLANVIEHRDLDSGEHVKRTQLYVKYLADYLVQNDSPYTEELQRLKPPIIVNAMALHDVGKIAIPDKILFKPDRLTPEEFAIMKTHTTRGKDIISELGDVNSSLYLKHCEDICYGHHERWDGTGYPRCLKEKEIPLPARLAAVADVYDALVSVRVYKQAMSHAEAAGLIAGGRGSQFDPVLSDAFLQVQNQFKSVAERYL